MKVKRFCSFQNRTWIFRFHVSNLTKYLTAFTSLVIFRFLNISLMSQCCIKKIILQKGRLGLMEMVVKFWPKKNIENIHFIQWFISITLGCQHFWECIKNQWSISYLFWWKWYYKPILNNNNNNLVLPAHFALSLSPVLVSAKSSASSYHRSWGMS